MTTVTTIIPTKDEALHVERCISSAAPLGPVIVLDAESGDATRELAEAAGARVFVHSWEGYAGQKNWALANLPLETEWVLFLDADEYLTAASRKEVRHCLTRRDVDGFYIARENVILGRPLRHAWWYPDYQMRLFRPSRARFEHRLVHEHVLVDGPTGTLREPLVHENLKGIGVWMERHIRYAALEAAEMDGAGAAQERERVSPRFFGTRAERRRALKTRVWYRLPFRPAIRFFWMYVVKRGFLDGREGLLYCQLVAGYEALIDAALFERRLERAQEGARHGREAGRSSLGPEPR